MIESAIQTTVSALFATTSLDAFLEAYENCKKTITLDDLRTKVEDGPHKGKSVLWLLAVAAYGHPQAFLEAWEKHKISITLDDLRTKAEDGFHKGQSMLSKLAVTATNGHSQAFLAIWDKFKGTISLDDLRTKAEDGLDKGTSVLWWLAGAAANGHSQAFLAIWDKFKDSITLDDLCVKAEDGCNKGASMLWWLVTAGANGHSQAFLAIWDKLKARMTLNDLRTTVENGSDKGKPVLWKLAAAAAKDPQSFLPIWDKFKDSISLNDLRTKVENGPDKGKSMLWLLAALVNVHPRLFQGVWDKFKDSITLDDLLVKAEDGRHKSKSVLWCLISATYTSGVIHNLFPELLARRRFIVDEKVLKEQSHNNVSILDLILRHPDKSWSQYVLKLIKSRNDLFERILQVQKSETSLTKKDIKSLSKLAEEAMAAGYLNAFYDLGVLLAEKIDCPHKKNLSEACFAFKRVPQNATSYYAANIQAANILLGEATQDDKINRNERLRHALIFALKSGDERNNLIQKICYCYITEGAGKDLCTTNPIHPSILENLSANSTVEGCFELFELVKKINRLTQEKNQLETKLSECPKPTPPLRFTLKLPRTSQPKLTTTPVITNGLNEAIKFANKREMIEEHLGNTLNKQPKLLKRCKE